MKILVSACLLGIKCRYDGAEKLNEAVARLAEKHELVPFCPEIYGGLPTPREPSEIRNGRVYTRSGRDVTAEYEKGAEMALKVARMLGCECALLQDRSFRTGALPAVLDMSTTDCLTGDLWRATERPLSLCGRQE